MKVVLLADVYKHGVAGEIVDVADGFARNWLLPKKLAVKASPTELKKLEALRSASAARKAALEGRLNDLAHQIDGVQLLFGRRASPTGKLFGSVTTSEIAQALYEKSGIDINRRRISQTALREVGIHEVPVRLGSEISPLLKVVIVREEDYARALAAANAPEVVAVEEVVEADGSVDVVIDDIAEVAVVEADGSVDVVVEETIMVEQVKPAAEDAE
ncbi:MAG: 50S ribosomal protein L9 [Anaerolineae bacterium]|nr:50S ribosomal protein L9 [Anaerolineae bacterium]